MDPRVCGDKLCSEIPGGRAAFEAGTVPVEEEETMGEMIEEKSKIDYFPPPLKQMKQGISPDEVTCNEGLQLIMRNGGSSACVRMETAIKLEERGWGVMPPMANQKQCEDVDGLWGIWGNQVPVIELCNPSTSDGGKECSDSSQCQSFCQAKEGAQIGIEDAGMCYGYELAICLQEVRNGVVVPEWCQ